MKKFCFLLVTIFVYLSCVQAQIPNGDFENWITVGSYEEPIGWNNCNAYSDGSFYPVTKSSDHYPLNVGSYSIRVENKTPLTNCSTYGFAQTCDNSNPCTPAFPITGHPTNFCGYYKFFPLNNDTMQIALQLFDNGVLVGGVDFITTNTVSNWTSFNIPISSYTSADSANITVAAFYNDTTCGFPFGPFGNSVLFVDNLSFDNLITSISKTNQNTAFNISPNPASTFITIETDVDEGVISVIDLSGNILLVEKLVQPQQNINIEKLPKGLYFIKLQTDNSYQVEKVIKQ